MFSKDFTQQEPICAEGQKAALAVMQSGRLFRYNNAPGEAGEVALLEKEFADYIGSTYCLACSSCGTAMQLALKCAGVQPGDPVLFNAFTLAPVPGAIERSGAKAVLVEIEPDNYTIDLHDLEQKAQKTQAKYLLLSHMRGHIADMDALMSLCRRMGILVIEDCAHTMGASWNGKKSGSFGHIACFSTQTYKHMNSGEGGLLVTNDPNCLTKAIIHSGSYMLYEKHLSRPNIEAFTEARFSAGNYSFRMDNLRAALLRVQLRSLDERCARWNKLYQHTELALRAIPYFILPKRSSKEAFVGSSIQFRIQGANEQGIESFVRKVNEQGIALQWFGSKVPLGFTSVHSSWQYLGAAQPLPASDAILSTLCDFRLPLTFSPEDCEEIGSILRQVAQETL